VYEVYNIQLFAVKIVHNDAMRVTLHDSRCYLCYWTSNVSDCASAPVKNTSEVGS